MEVLSGGELSGGNCLGGNSPVTELPGPFANVGAPQTDHDRSNPPENAHKNVFLEKVFIKIYYVVIPNYSFDLS